MSKIDDALEIIKGMTLIELRDLNKAIEEEFGVTAAAPVAMMAAPAAGNRPNIVLMMADDQAWGETGYNGHPYVKTPVLDEMARTTLRLDRFYAGSPVCSPTRASVMTGRHANRSGAFAPN